MKELTLDQVQELDGAYERWTACGIAVGVNIGATFFFHGVGFALTINKALVACALDALA